MISSSSTPQKAQRVDAPHPAAPHEETVAVEEHKDRSAWRQRLVDAETGFRIGIRSESTLFVYFFVGCVIITAAMVLGLSPVEWSIVVLALGTALSTEFINQLFRQLAGNSLLKIPKELEEIARLGSAAVFVANLTAVTILTILFWPHIAHLLQG